MTNSEKLAILTEWQTNMKASESDIEQFIAPLECAPESALYAIPWKLMDAYTKAVAQLVGDQAEWLSWHWSDNEWGEKSLEAGPTENMRQIKTLDDLVWLIEVTA